MPFQKQVNLQQAPAVEGDFATANPRSSVVAPEGGFVAGEDGVIVGRFAWVQEDGRTVLNKGTGKPDGFVHREQQALITEYLAEAGMMIPKGFAVTLQRTGDYWVKATGGEAKRGQKAYASPDDGTVSFKDAAARAGDGVETDFVCSQACAEDELAVITF